MELIDVKGLMQRVNLNYNNNQMISVSALKDIINTQPKISLEDIKAEIQGNYPLYLYPKPYEQAINDVLQILDKHIKENKQ